MVFTSYQFLLFLPVVLALYFVIPASWRVSWLLVVSCLFYMNFHPGAPVILALVTGVSWYAGICLEKASVMKAEGASGQAEEGFGQKSRTIWRMSLLFILFVFVVFKYTDFILENINGILPGTETVALPFSLVVPVGISYYTFQVISYLADVRQGKIQAEKHILRYALYVTFFPKIISGPIERAEGFLVQIRECRQWNLWDGRRVRDGLVLMMWGYFQKLVIADRLAILTGEVFGHYQSYGSVELFVGAAAFYLQLYADFDGYTNIARGTAKIMGFTLAENFRAPFFARSIREYWGRWHISLSSWLRDYIYIPLGGNRKGELRRLLNLMVTFLVSGFWHGAAWNYVFWGVLHGVYEVAECVSKPWVDRLNRRLHTRTESFSYRLFQTVKCWLLVCFAYIFFKTPTALDGFRYLKRMATKWNPWVLFDGSLYTLGISRKYVSMLFLAVALLLLVDRLKYKKGMELDLWLSKQCIWFRWSVMLGCILAVIILGAYGPDYDAADFIYFQFN